MSPLVRDASISDVGKAVADASRSSKSRRPAIAAQLARGVSVDMLLRSHTQGPNKQEKRGARARSMIHRLRSLDSRSVVSGDESRCTTGAAAVLPRLDQLSVAEPPPSLQCPPPSPPPARLRIDCGLLRTAAPSLSLEFVSSQRLSSTFSSRPAIAT